MAGRGRVGDRRGSGDRGEGAGRTFRCAAGGDGCWGDTPPARPCASRGVRRLYADTESLASAHTGFMSDQRRQDAEEPARKHARANDYQSLQEQKSLGKHKQPATHHSAPLSSLGSFSARTATEATPRMRSEKLDVTALFYRQGDSGDFVTHELPPFDDDEFENFQEEHSEKVCVFFKWRSSARIYQCDTWLGSCWPRHGGQGLRGAEEMDSDTFSCFRRWLVSDAGPEWGKDVNWPLIEKHPDRHMWCHDQCDDEKDIRFTSRWVSA